MVVLVQVSHRTRLDCCAIPAIDIIHSRWVLKGRSLYVKATVFIISRSLFVQTV